MTHDVAPAHAPWAWPFTFSDLTAGLRKYRREPSLMVEDVRPMTLPFQRPAIGRVRGVEVDFRTRSGDDSIGLVIKEPLGSTRLGLAGVGRREVGVYRHLAPQLPMRMPGFIAGSEQGAWLILEAIHFGRSSSRWPEAVYRRAIDSLIRLHDRFWNLGEDLGNFPWLGRPLEGDFEIHRTAADHALETIVEQGTPASLAESPDRLAMLHRLTYQAEAVAAPLRDQPTTLLHGDFWPGNIALDRDQELVVYDWQLTSIGPPVLDLVTLVKKTEWWFPEAPLTAGQMVEHYRSGLAALGGQRWSDTQWDLLWDHALLWRFLQEWLDLLAAIPESLLAASVGQLEAVWLDPVADALRRRLGPESES